MKTKTMKITGILLTFVMIVSMLGMFSITASAADRFNAETWGEYSKNASERIYTYADFSPFNTSTNGGKTGTIDAP